MAKWWLSEWISRRQQSWLHDYDFDVHSVYARVFTLVWSFVAYMCWLAVAYQVFGKMSQCRFCFVWIGVFYWSTQCVMIFHGWKNCFWNFKIALVVELLVPSCSKKDLVKWCCNWLWWLGGAYHTFVQISQWKNIENFCNPTS